MHVRARTEIGPNIAVMADARPLPNDIASAGGRQAIDIALISDTHGAFVWGVLDRLLDEPGLSFGNITASGFGAMEAAVLAYGLALGGQRGARTALTNFWRRISHASMFVSNTTNPLRSILEQSIDIEEICKKSCPVKLSILASNARTDAVKVFSGDQLSIDAILAAATVPFFFPAVEIDGETYWGDGDRSALPPVQPVEAGHLLIIAGEPSGFMTPCAVCRLAANHGATKPTLIHYIFDSQHRAGAALFTRPWIDWGELTDKRDRGRERAGDWLLADHVFVDERQAVDSKNRYV
jgi:NTE family protein